MSTPNLYTVGPHGPGWIISYDDSTVINLATHDIAVTMARILAAEAAPSRLLIVDRDGSTTEEDFPLPPTPLDAPRETV